MKFLVIQTAFIGDVILATPLIEKIHRCIPGAIVDILVRKGNESLLTEHPKLRKTIIWDKKNGKYANLWRLLRQIRQEKYDVVVNCQRFAASGLLTAFSGAAMRIGFDKNPFARFFTHRIRHQIADTKQFAHEVDRNLSLLSGLCDDSPERPKLYPSPADERKAEALAEGGPFICIAPNSVWFTKQWPAHQWIRLIGLLPPHIRILLLGSPADHAACEHIRAAHPDRAIQNLCGQLNLLQSAAVLRRARMNYVNDSAPLHLASAVNAPVCAIFCSTIPAFGFTPLSDRSIVVETEIALDCRPCGLHGYKACPKGHFRCAESIDPKRLIFQETV